MRKGGKEERREKQHKENRERDIEKTREHGGSGSEEEWRTESQRKKET